MSVYAPGQDACKSLEELETLKGTLQPEHGIHMRCRPRVGA
jgi:hypothetical protein